MDNNENTSLVNKMLEDAAQADLQANAQKVEEADKVMDVIVLTQGTLADGDNFWAYTAIPPSKYMSFVEAEKRGNYNLEEYGKIIKWAKGSRMPSDEVRKEMEEKHGVNHQFEEQLKRKTEELVEDQTQRNRILEKFGIKPKM